MRCMAVSVQHVSRRQYSAKSVGRDSCRSVSWFRTRGEYKSQSSSSRNVSIAPALAFNCCLATFSVDGNCNDDDGDDDDDEAKNPRNKVGCGSQRDGDDLGSTVPNVPPVVTPSANASWGECRSRFMGRSSESAVAVVRMEDDAVSFSNRATCILVMVSACRFLTKDSKKAPASSLLRELARRFRNTAWAKMESSESSSDMVKNRDTLLVGTNNECRPTTKRELKK